MEELKKMILTESMVPIHTNSRRGFWFVCPTSKKQKGEKEDTEKLKEKLEEIVSGIYFSLDAEMGYFVNLMVLERQVGPETRERIKRSFMVEKIEITEEGLYSIVLKNGDGVFISEKEPRFDFSCSAFKDFFGGKSFKGVRIRHYGSALVLVSILVSYFNLKD
jgi:hypothetical protein